MLDDIREWISDNLRWILLGLSAILVIVIVVVAVRLVTHIGGGSKTQQETQTTAGEQSGTKASEEGETAAEEQNGTASEGLTKDQADVLAAATSYWTAIKENDFDTLESLCGKTYDDEARAEVQKMDQAVESYSGISTYSKPGLTSGSYVVYVYMELHLTGIDTAAPRLSNLYMEPNSDGSLKVVEVDLNDTSSEITAYVNSCTADDDVQALVKDVNATLAERCEQDEELNQYVESVSTQSQTDSGTEDETGSTEESDASDVTVGTQTGTMKVSVEGGANVRSDASTDGSIVASLANGSTVEVLENLDSGWSRIQFVDSSGSTVEGYMMTQFLSAQ